MTQFCHISPNKLISDAAAQSGRHLLLAHLVANDPKYVDTWNQVTDGKYRIMDNSLFECFMEGTDPFNPQQLIEMAQRVHADCIVLPDTPYGTLQENIEQAEPVYREAQAAGLDTMFVPQSPQGDIETYVEAVDYGLTNCELVGISILGAPVALGVDPKEKWKRYPARAAVFHHLDAMGLIDNVRGHCYGDSRFHCLGMTDGPREIELLQQFHDVIASWDSSAAVWAGCENTLFDLTTMSGLRDGKIQSHVDFNHIPTSRQSHIAHQNMRTLNTVLKECMGAG